MFLESLESRKLFSATPSVPGSPLGPIIAMDRAQIHLDLAKFEFDVASFTVKLDADGQALKTDGARKNPALSPLFQTLHSNLETMWAQLRADNLAESQAVLKDDSAIAGDRLQILKDQGNPTALKVDHAKLVADMITLQSDEVTGLNSRVATRQSFFSELSVDLTALSTAAQSITGASPQLLADIAAFTADRSSALSTFTADLQAISADRSKLIVDLTTLESQL